MDSGQKIMHSHRGKVSYMWLIMSFYLNSLMWILYCLVYISLFVLFPYLIYGLALLTGPRVLPLKHNRKQNLDDG
jgi:hypothetical protein